MADALTPPQGLIAITDRRKIYGFPMGLGVGGGGTKVTASLPPAYRQGGGQVARLIGEYEPAVLPPVVEYPVYGYQYPAGMRVSVVASAAIPGAISSCSARAVVVPDASIPKARNGGAFQLASVSVVTIP